MYNETMNNKLMKDIADATIQLKKNEFKDKILKPKMHEYTYFTSPLDNSEILNCIKDDLKYLSLLEGNLHHQSIWISSVGSGTRAHYDAFDNTFVQISGRKRLRI